MKPVQDRAEELSTIPSLLILQAAFSRQCHTVHLERRSQIYIQKMITLVNDLVKNPKDAYARFSKSPHFEKYTEVALLALFILGVRLVISSHFLGYVFLGMFVYRGKMVADEFWKSQHNCT